MIYLAEHAARLKAIQGSYLRNVAGPHDRQLMNEVEAGLQTNSGMSASSARLTATLTAHCPKLGSIGKHTTPLGQPLSEPP